MTARLVCVGDVVIDITARVSAFPERGGDVLADSGGIFAGGAGFNVMVAASRLGVNCAYAGTHGTGPFGDLARAALLKEGIQALHQPVIEADTGWDVAITDAESERTFITLPGAEAMLTANRLADIQVLNEDIVYVSGYGLLIEPNRAAITSWLSQLPSSTVVITDPGPLVADIPEATLRAVFERTTWWSCNQAESLASTGADDPNEAALLLGATRSDTGNMGVIVRLGPNGCLVLPPGERSPLLVPGYPVEAVDSNGAGDAHVGAFIAGIAAGMTPILAAKRANAAAAFAVTRSGPATGPTAIQLEQFLAP